MGRDWSTYMVKLPKNLIPLSVQSACRRVLFLSRSICQDNKQCVKGGVNRSCCSIQPRETCCTAAIRVASSTRPPKATRTNKIVLTIWMIRMNFNLKHFWRKNVFYLVDAHFVAFDQLEGRAKVKVGVGVLVCHDKGAFFSQPHSRLPDWKWYLFVRLLFRFPKFDSILFLSAFTDIFHLIPGQKDKIHDSWKDGVTQIRGHLKVVDELFVFLAKERSEAPAGERGSPTPSAAENVERKLQHIWTKWLQQKQRAFWKKNSQKMRTILSSSPQKIYLEKVIISRDFVVFK